MGDNRYERGGRSTVRGGMAGRRVAPQPNKLPSQGGAGRQRVKPVWFVAIMDLLVLGIALNVFALGNSSFLRPPQAGRNCRSKL